MGNLLGATASDLAIAVRALEVRTNRFEGMIRGVVAQVGAAGVALEREHMIAARRQLARLRAGDRRVGILGWRQM